MGVDQQEAFGESKDVPNSAPVIRAPIPFGENSTCILMPAVLAMGGALYQDFGEDAGYPKDDWSRCFSAAEVNYQTADQQLCAIINSVKSFSQGAPQFCPHCSPDPDFFLN